MLFFWELQKVKRRFGTFMKNYNSVEKTLSSLQETRRIWDERLMFNFLTGDQDFDRFMKWVCFQPYLRRLYGCSFLPHHDYGRGGRGWRDLWQDCLSLLLMDPHNVGKMIENNYGGVRIDGTNATIIGDGDGNFIADREQHNQSLDGPRTLASDHHTPLH